MAITYSGYPGDIDNYTHVMITEGPLGGYVVTLYRGVSMHELMYVVSGTVLSGNAVYALTEAVDEALQVAANTGLVVM